MSKERIISIIIITLLILLIVFAIGFYIYDIAANGSSPTENLFKMLAAVFVCLGGLGRFCMPRLASKHGLVFYEVQYAEHIKEAFKHTPSDRRRLLTAVKLYNENKFARSIRILGELKGRCKARDDIYATGLFLGLCLTDMGLSEEAVRVYNQMIDNGAISTTVYGNLGSLYSGLGRYDDAIASLRLSIQNDEKNPAPYNNLAKLYFDTYDFENAKKYAKLALEINHKFRQSATLLAIVYTLEGDMENAEKYTHIAVSSGETPGRLKAAIEYYKEGHKATTDE